MRRRDRLGVAAALAAVVALLALAPAAGATVYVVNTTADHAVGACDAADCTLREALTVATGADSVTLPSGIYNLDPVLNELDLTGATLTGAGARTTIIDGGLATRVLATASDVSASPVVNGVTIRRGSALGSANTNIGGAVRVAGALTIINSQVLDSVAETHGGGIGLGSGDDLLLIGSTVAGNTSTGGSGGGIYSDNEGIVAVSNSTISGNTAGDGDGGGIFAGSGTGVSLVNTTIASNAAAAGGGTASVSATFQNTIFAGNSGGNCAVTGTVTAHDTLSTDSTCELVANGNIVGANPGLGPLQNNGGPTHTRAIGFTSPALNNGGAGCPATDQRGVARESVCDIGAYEFVRPRLTVFKQVVNDQGGTQTPSDFTVHVRAGQTDVAGSPAAGTSAGRAYRLAPGTYTVREDADSRYAASFSGDCGTNGVVTLAEGQTTTCTITNRDKPPVAGRIVNAEPTRGTVKIKLPGRRRFRELEEGEQLPVGTVVDTLRGRVRLFAASNKKGGLAKGLFYAGIFKLGQTKGKKPITVLTLVEKLTGCKTKKKVSAAAKKKRKRRLWGDGKGRFRTKGKHSAATVVGTKWLVEDRCTSTLTRVVRGKVRVRDLVKRKTVLVRAGQRYLAKQRP